MNDGDTAEHFLSSTPRVIIKAMMMYDFTGIMSQTLLFATSIFLIRCTFLNSILMNMFEKTIIVTIQPIVITTEVVSIFIHATMPILQTLSHAISQIMPAIKASDFVFIYKSTKIPINIGVL